MGFEVPSTPKHPRIFPSAAPGLQTDHGSAALPALAPREQSTSLNEGERKGTERSEARKGAAQKPQHQFLETM